MDVRQARPTDAPLVLTLALDRASHLVTGTDWPRGNPLLCTLGSVALPLPMPGRVWIAHDGDGSALLEAAPRRYVIGWDITRLAARGRHLEPIAAVVGAATEHLQRRGIPRLFARTHNEQVSTLEQLDFRPLAREYVVTGRAGPGERGEAPLPPDSRYRMPQDAWPLHQLATDVTPALVRSLEGSTSLEWSERPGTVEVVVERDGRIVAWAGWSKRGVGGGHRIGMVLHDDYADLGPPLLAHVLRSLPDGAPVRAHIREYQGHTLRVFLDAGCQLAGEEVVMVKHGQVQLAPMSVRAQAVRIPAVPIAPIQLRSSSGTPALAPVGQVEEEHTL